MVDTASKKDTVLKIVEVLTEHKGNNILSLSIGDYCSWTDFFIIVTASGSAHLKSLQKYVRQFLKIHGIEPLSRQKIIENDTWVLIDCGYFVVHIMDEEKRLFYELEKLWYMGEVIYPSKSSMSSPSSYS